MGSPIANMLLAQAAPAGDALSGLSPEAQAALRALNGGAGVPAGAPPATMNDQSLGQPNQQMMNNVIQGAVDRSNAPGPALAQNHGIGDMLMGWLSSVLPSTKSIAPTAQATQKPLTPEELAERNRRISGQQ